MTDINNDAEAYRLTAKTQDGNLVEAFVLPSALHSSRRNWTEEYGQVDVVPVTLEEMEEVTGVAGLAAELRAK